MKTKQCLFLIILVIQSLCSAAQNVHFVKSGRVEFEKTVNMFAILKAKAEANKLSNTQLAYERFKQNEPQFLKSKTILFFQENKSLYRSETEAGVFKSPVFGEDPRYEISGLILSDFTKGYFAKQTKILNEQSLVKDSLLRIKWKLTDEVRDIAGYSCRRANGLILDSIYVVAFFTEKILSPAGPEMFSGLPGMILGLALPHDHMNWFATKVTESNIDSKIFEQPLKGRTTNFKEITSIINRTQAIDKTMLKWYLLL